MIIHFFVLTLTAIIMMLCVSPKTTLEWPGVAKFKYSVILKRGAMRGGSEAEY